MSSDRLAASRNRGTHLRWRDDLPAHNSFLLVLPKALLSATIAYVFFAYTAMPHFPSCRQRRLRHTPWLRSLHAEHQLSASDLIWPVFVTEAATSEPIIKLPGQMRWCLQDLIRQAEHACNLGIPALALFPIVPSSKKSAQANEALNPNQLICRAIQAIKNEKIPIGLIADVALDPYTSHGHDGILNEQGDIDNDTTVEILRQQALLLAQSGADVVAPSDMMDGRIAAIRDTLEQHKHTNTLILAYTAKYASALYAPFRCAIGASSLGQASIGPKDKASYQMQPTNVQEALQAAHMHVQEGADILMVKPGSLYLDVVANISKTFTTPCYAYHVSGEYLMLKQLADGDTGLEHALFTESLLGCKRAGAQAIISYYAIDFAKK